MWTLPIGLCKWFNMPRIKKNIKNQSTSSEEGRQARQERKESHFKQESQGRQGSNTGMDIIRIVICNIS